MDQDEQQLDNFIANANQPVEPTTQPQTDEEIVEQKAREGKPSPTTVLQKRTELDEVKLERRIEHILTRNAGKIDETELRQQIADRLQANGRVTEADLIQIRDSLLKKYEKAEAEKREQEKTPVVEPPPVVSSGLNVAASQAGKLADWASALKTPGGVGLLVFVLMFFVWVIVPMSNGKTRMQLLWGILTGQVDFRADVRERAEDAAREGEAVAYGGEAVGEFGNGAGGSILQFPDFSIEY